MGGCCCLEIHTLALLLSLPPFLALRVSQSASSIPKINLAATVDPRKKESGGIEAKGYFCFFLNSSSEWALDAALAYMETRLNLRRFLLLLGRLKVLFPLCIRDISFVCKKSLIKISISLFSQSEDIIFLLSPSFLHLCLRVNGRVARSYHIWCRTDSGASYFNAYTLAHTQTSLSLNNSSYYFLFL